MMPSSCWAPLLLVAHIATAGSSSSWPHVVEHAGSSSLDGLREALARARVHRAAGRDVVVQLHGRYALNSTLDLGELLPAGLLAQSHYPAASQQHGVVTLRGPAVFDGGVEISGWTKDASRPWLFVANVPSALQGINVTQMWDGERRVALARTGLMHFNRSGPVNATTTLTDSIITNPGQVDPALDLTSARVFIYHTWDVSYHPIALVRNSAPASGHPITPEIVVTNMISMRWNGGGLAGGSGNRYYLEGAEAFLKSGSGMFFHDVAGGRLLYVPVGGAQPGNTVVARLAELVRSDSVNDVIVESLTFEHAAADFTPCFAPASACETQSAADEIVAALHWSNSQRVTVHNITVRHTGGYGLWFAAGCHDSSASFVQMSDLGAGGVRIGSATGDAYNISLTDSTLQDGGHVWRQGCGVLMQAANGSLVSHNIVRGFSYTGISVGWQWGFGRTGNANSVISSNYVSTIGQGELSDM